MRTALGGQASSLPNEYLSKELAGRMPALPVLACNGVSFCVFCEFCGRTYALEHGLDCYAKGTIT